MDTLKDLIEKARFDYVNFLINDRNFPKPEIVKTSGWKLVQVTEALTSEEAIALIDKDGYRPANLYELIEWKRTNGKALDKFTWVVGFGQVLQDDGMAGPRVPFISCDEIGIFTLSMGFYNSKLGGNEFLLSVQK